MRTTSVSLVIIVLALASIVAGFLGGQASSYPPAIVMLHPGALPSAIPVSARTLAAALLRVSDAPVLDSFSNDDVVVERRAAQSTRWVTPRLSFVIGLSGESAVVESQFLRLGIPLAFDIDPNGHDAAAFAKLARTAGDLVFVHAENAPSAAWLQALENRIGRFDGIASHTDRGMAQALAIRGLAFFDEAGGVDSRPFKRAGVKLIKRDTTVDDHTSEGYITYMLHRAEMRARRAGRVVVFMRPQPNSLAVLNRFVENGSADIAALR